MKVCGYALAILSFAGTTYVFAAPTQPPSSGAGVDLPLHIGSAAQVKAGDLTVNGTLTAAGNLNVGATLSTPYLCLNGNCQSTWPSANSIQSGSGTGPTPIGSNYYSTYGGSSSQNWNVTLYYSNGVYYSNFNNYYQNINVSVTINAPGPVALTGETR